MNPQMRLLFSIVMSCFAQTPRAIRAHTFNAGALKMERSITKAKNGSRHCRIVRRAGPNAAGEAAEFSRSRG